MLGLRSHEILRVRFEDLDVRAELLYVRSAKKGINRRIPVGMSWANCAREHGEYVRTFCPPTKSNRRGLLFLTGKGEPLAYEGLLRTCKRWTFAVFDRAYTLHCLRHTAAVRLYEATGSVLEVNRLLGHRSLQWTSDYLRSLDGRYRTGLASFVYGEVNKEVRLYDPEELAIGKVG